MNKRQTEFWDLCRENMSAKQRATWMALVNGSLVEFMHDLTLVAVQALSPDSRPIYLMYAKAAGKGQKEYSDQTAFKYLQIFDGDLEAMKKERPPKVSRVGVCCAVCMHCVTICALSFCTQ